MGLSSLIGRWFAGKGHGVDELARRLGMRPEELRAVEPAYREFTIPKRSGGSRCILAPEPGLKQVQQLILRRLLRRLRSHPCATGFERGHSIVSHARHHAGRKVVIRMDLVDFFPSTSERRVSAYFRRIGWNREAASLLVRLCTRDGGLPQGAPTSPRLSNLVNYRLDARIAALAERHGAAYSRYADDLTVSLDTDSRETPGKLIRGIRRIVRDEGYLLHRGRKFSVRRQHTRQLVTGLVVNERVRLPRETRRWLRAVEHRASKGSGPTLTEAQLAGWRSLQSMIETQSRA